MELNKIYCENCLETMSRMPDNFIDLTVTSPPYDNLRDYKGYEFDFESIAKELFRVTKKGGVVVWVVGDATINGSETGTSFKQALYFKEIGFNLHDTMIWYKLNPMPLPDNQKRYASSIEYMFILSKDKPKYGKLLKCKSNNVGRLSGKTGQRNKDGTDNNRKIIKKIQEEKILDNVWLYSSVCDTENKGHPAPFPEDLVKDHIISWSDEKKLIYDPFMGSGTTAKMSHLMDRNWVGSEISQEYVDLANKRIKPYLMQQKIQFNEQRND